MASPQALPLLPTAAALLRTPATLWRGRDARAKVHVDDRFQQEEHGSDVLGYRHGVPAETVAPPFGTAGDEPHRFVRRRPLPVAEGPARLHALSLARLAQFSHPLLVCDAALKLLQRRLARSACGLPRASRG
jgi:hypothetical protein